jgi:hypothetical protein
MQFDEAFGNATDEGGQVATSMSDNSFTLRELCHSPSDGSGLVGHMSQSAQQSSSQFVAGGFVPTKSAA